MCTSSTATPAATDGGLPAGAEKNTSSGRRRLPPALSASRDTAETVPPCECTVSCRRSSSSSR